MNVIDMHCDTISEIYLRKKEGEQIGIDRNHLRIDLEKLKKGGCMVQNFALFTPLKGIGTTPPFLYGMDLLAEFYDELHEYRDIIRPVKTYEEIEENQRAGRMSALLTLEEGEMCMGRLSLLEAFYHLGARMMTLTWNYPNSLAYPARSADTGEGFAGEEYGLTETGITFVREMERLGMIIDVSHLNDAGVRDILKYTSCPIVASHSNARALCSHPRNLSDELIRSISERGGVIGINFYAEFLRDWKPEEKKISKIEDMIRHMKHMKQIGGIQCIGLGSDFDGFEGESEMRTAEDFPVLDAAMEQAGFTVSEREDIFYRNVLRVYREIL